MPSTDQPKGSWAHRFAIRFFTILLALLIFWAEGFLLGDLKSARGPEYGEVEARHLDAALVERRDRLVEEITDLDREIKNRQERLGQLQAHSRSLQQTVGQLIELERLALEKERTGTVPAEMGSSLEQFLANQERGQALSREIASRTEARQALEAERLALEKKIEAQRRPAREEHRDLMRRHRLRMAGLQLALLLPLLAVGGLMLLRARGSAWFPLCLAFSGATLLQVALVMHQCFPSRYFKYVLVAAAILVVGRLLLHFIRLASSPRPSWMLKRYREAYERFLCPVCEFPIRRGPRRHLFWTRSSVSNLRLPATDEGEDAPYHCPSCGTTLHEPCAACGKTRHALLPACEHCGAEKQLPGVEGDQAESRSASSTS